MPRLAPVLIRRAGSISPHVATLLPACRTIESARAELRWIRQHVLDSLLPGSGSGSGSGACRQLSRRDNTNDTPPPPAPTPAQETGRALPRDRAGIAQPRLLVASRGRSRSRSRNGDGGVRRGAGPGDVVVEDAETRIARLVARRGAGEPLQYVLGTQPFGDLEMLCGRGVLIPRPETEAWVAMLADLVFSSPSPSPFCSSPFSSPSRRDPGSSLGGMRSERKEEKREGEEKGEKGEEGNGPLRILDLCAGTGCIGLALYARGMAMARREAGRRRAVEGSREIVRQRSPRVRLYGFDVEPRAVRLARRNLAHNLPALRPPTSILKEEDVEKAITFRQADIFTDTWLRYLDAEDTDPKPPSDKSEDEEEYEQPPQQQQQQQQQQQRQRRIDILVSNPPYISQRGFETSTSRSVRNHEPRLALVPSPSLSPSPSKHPPPEAACVPADVFYARLLEIADAARPRMAAFEVGDMAQAMRVVAMAMTHAHIPTPTPTQTDEHAHREGEKASSPRWAVIEIWRDWPDCAPSGDEEDAVLVRGREIPVRGSGHGRVVFLSEGPAPRTRAANRGFRREVYKGDLA